MKEKKFTVNLEDDKTVEIIVRSPTNNDRKESQKYYNAAFTAAIKSGAIVRAKLEDVLVEQGLWDEAKQIRFDTIQKQISDNDAKLKKGGIPLSAAKEIALEMRKLRMEFRDIISDKTSLDTQSAEGQADSERFSYYVYACTFRADNNKRYFNSYNDYMQAGDDPVSVKAAAELANLLYGLEADYESKLPENQFLLEYNFVDEKLRFINKDGHLTDIEGRLVNEDGRYIDNEGNFVDKYGRPLDEDGNLRVVFSPFTDEDGNPVVKKDNSEEESQKPKSKKSNKKVEEEDKER